MKAILAFYLFLTAVFPANAASDSEEAAAIALFANAGARLTLSLENINAFTPDHMKAVAGIATLEHLLIDARKNPFDTDPLVAVVRELRPGLDVQVAGVDAKGPPRPVKK